MKLEMGCLCMIMTGCSADVCSPPVQVTEIPMLAHDGHDIVPVTIDGVALGLRLETANFATSLSPGIVAELGLVTDTGGSMMGTGGLSYFHVVHVPKLEIGSGELDNGTLIVPTNSSMNEDLAPSSGALGSDILNNWDVDIEASSDTLRLFKPQTCASPVPPWKGPYQSIYTATRSSSFNVLVPVTINGRNLTAAIDSGEPETVVSWYSLRVGEASLRDARTAELPGVGQDRIMGRDYHVSSFAVDGHDYGSTSILVSRGLVSGRRDVDVLLGEDFMRKHRIYIAYAAGWMFISSAP